MQKLFFLVAAASIGLYFLGNLTSVLKASSPTTAETQDMTTLELIDLGTLGGDTHANDLNNAGQIVGTSAETPTRTLAFIWQAGVLTPLTTPAEASSSAEAINQHGHIVGQTTLTDTQPTLWASDVVSPLETMTDTLSLVHAINANGLMAGQTISENANALQLWQPDATLSATVPFSPTGTVYALNAASTVVGEEAGRAFRWEPDGFVDLGTLGGSTSHATAINDLGRIVGTSALAGDLGVSLFVWQDGNMRDIGVPATPPGTLVEAITARDINDNGMVVGSYTVQSSQLAFMWKDGVFTDLSNLIPAGSGWETLLSASAVNAQGWIVGTGLRSGEERAFLLKLPTPIYRSYLPVVVGYIEPEPKIDIAPYLVGNGQLYEVRHSQGSQARHQTQFAIGRYYHTKGNEISAEWEELWNSAEFIYRGTDTSPGGGRYYSLYENDVVGSKWAPRYWRVGEIYERNPHVVFFDKASCNVVASGFQRSWLKFMAVHDSYTFDTGITVNNVIQLAWLLSADGKPEEEYFYSAEFGLVGWGSRDRGYSAISEIHAPGTRPDNQREIIDCLGNQNSLNGIVGDGIELNYGPLPPGYRAK